VARLKTRPSLKAVFPAIIVGHPRPVNLVTIASRPPEFDAYLKVVRHVIRRARDLSPDQKIAIESLLGRAIAEDEAISIRTIAPASAPEWIQKSWESAERLGLDRLSMEEIDAEIEAARKARQL